MSAGIVSGVFLGLRLLMFYGVFASAWTLMQSGFHLDVWIGRAWQTIAITVGLWAAQRTLLLWADRSWRLEEERRSSRDARLEAGA